MVYADTTRERIFRAMRSQAAERGWSFFERSWQTKEIIGPASRIKQNHFYTLLPLTPNPDKPSIVLGTFDMIRRTYIDQPAINIGDKWLPLRYFSPSDRGVAVFSSKFDPEWMSYNTFTRGLSTVVDIRDEIQSIQTYAKVS